MINKTIDFVKETLAGAEGGHDWFHIQRVWNNAKMILEQEGEGDRLTVELAALLHDISDPKFNDGDEDKGSQIAYNFLSRQGLDRDRIEHIQTIIKYTSFKGGFNQGPLSSIEFRIVQDADRLDALGAIGIARAFNYGGFKNRPLHNPEIRPAAYDSPESYRNSDAPTINHFYEKLLKLKDLMNTETGRKLAEERHKFMQEYLDRFFSEWDPGSHPDQESEQI